MNIVLSCKNKDTCKNIEKHILDKYNNDNLVITDELEEAGEMLSTKRADMAILVCNSSIKSFIAVIKYPNVRVAQVYAKEFASSSREHNDANAIALSEKYNTLQDKLEMIDIFLQTKFSNEQRHIKRIQLIE